MNSVISKIIASLLSLLLLAYVGYQGFLALYDPYQTELVNVGEYVTDVDLNGFFVRNEEVIDIQKTGVISYNYKNAQKISRDSTVAHVYQTESDLFNLKKIQSLKSQKAILAEAQNKESIEGLKLDLLNSQISASKAELRAEVDNDDLTNIDKIYNELLLNINKIAVCVDSTINYDGTIAGIDTQIAALEAKMPTDIREITTDKSGYFSDTIDGYEEEFNFASMKKLSVADVEGKLKKKAVKPKVNNNIGKLVYDNYWYFVCTIPENQIEELSKSFNKGQPIKLKFNSKSTREVYAQIESITPDKQAKKSVVIFKSLYLDDDLINMRFETPKAIISSYEGVIIPKEAIRIKDGVKNEQTGEVSDRVKGVYALIGRNPQFKKVDILYEDDYVLVSRPSNSSDYVSIYDRVITKGRNLNADTAAK